MKRFLRIAVDAAMFAVFVYLMSYRAGRGLWLHGVWGIALLALFLLHNALNLYWHRQLLQGRYSPMRRFTTGVNALLAADVALIALSSLFMAGDIFESVPFYTTQGWRSLHVLSTSWGLVLMLLHLGLHTADWLGGLMKPSGNAARDRALRALFYLVLAAGAVSFWLSGLWQDMLALGKGNEPFSWPAYYADHVLVAAAACQVSFLAIRELRRRRRMAGRG